MPIGLTKVAAKFAESDRHLKLDDGLVRRWLVQFLRDECIRRRGVQKAIVGLSGGVDSAVTTALSVEAFGAENVFVFRLPYKKSSKESLDHAQMIIDQYGLDARTIDITQMADGYREPHEPEMSDSRLGNVCARCRMIVLYDQAAKLGGLPIGTGNKTERLFGYFTWHADDSPPINPLGDLFKTQVWDLAREMDIPKEIVEKPATADLIEGQTDEADFGISYQDADRILVFLTKGYPAQKLVDMGFKAEQVEVVYKRVSGTHWKRRMPTVAMVSDSAIGEYYRRPVDY